MPGRHSRRGVSTPLLMLNGHENEEEGSAVDLRQGEISSLGGVL